MTFPITSLYAIPLALIMLVLWLRVTQTRAAAHISIGEADNVALHEHVRRHGNFIEWVPLTLVLMALAELQGASAAWLHAAGALALVGRLTHPFGLHADNAGHPLRIVGNLGNILAMLILIAALVRALLVT